MTGKKIVIVDDDKMIRKLLESILAKEGYQVYSARDGEDGLAQIATRNPDAVILDVMMPKMGGFEVITELKRSKLTSHIPVIMLTSIGLEEDIAKGKALGAAFYLIKPVQRELLFECLRAVLK